MALTMATKFSWNFILMRIVTLSIVLFIILWSNRPISCSNYAI